jgi:hypothetical protein
MTSKFDIKSEIKNQENTAVEFVKNELLKEEIYPEETGED